MANQLIKQARAKLKETQAFFTTDEVCEKLLGHLAEDYELRGVRVLEPSAGTGHLADWLHGPGMQVTAVELDAENFDHLARLRGVRTMQADFLGLEPSHFPEGFEAVVMNPPFSRGQDMTHVMHAFRFLVPGGVLLAVISPAFEHLSTRPATQFREFVSQYGGVVEKLPAGTFKESGTNVRTLIIKLTKPE